MYTYDFFSVGLAECQWRFVEQPQNWEWFCRASDSALEYCLKHFEEFKTWLENKYGYSVALPLKHG